MAKDGGKGCYWGFGTRGNRIAWGLVVLAVVLGTAFWIPGIIEVKKCINKHSACACSPIAGVFALASKKHAGNGVGCLAAA